jgi:SAM-dependent methyltransferase
VPTAEGGTTAGQARRAEREYARRFAAEHEHFDVDLAFWRKAAERLGGPVLDVGCASGRVALRLAEDGHEVWAMDSSRPMLDELSARAEDGSAELAGRIRPVCARMQDFDLGRTFPLVILAMNTMQLLLTAGDRAAAMACLARHVAPDGELLLDVARLDVAEVRGVLGMDIPIVAHRRENGALQVQVARYQAFDEETRTLEFSIDISEAPPEGASATCSRHHKIHMYEPGEVEALAAEAGLRVRDVAGDFAGAPPGPAADHQVFRLGRAGRGGGV